MVADLVAPERRQSAYASVRVAANMGVVVGPPLGGLLLVLGGWTALFPCVAVLSAMAWLVAYRYLPRRGAFALIGLQARNSFGYETTWALFAFIGVVAAMIGGLALAGLDRRAGPEPSAVLEA